MRRVAVDVYYTFGTTTYALVESNQDLQRSDGKYERRERRTGTSVSETLHDGEDPIDGAVRGIREELKINVDSLSLKEAVTECETTDGRSYSGLGTNVTTRRYRLVLTGNDIQPGGYIEATDKNITTFQWIVVACDI